MIFSRPFPLRHAHTRFAVSSRRNDGNASMGTKNRRQKRKRGGGSSSGGLHLLDQTFSCATQNVNGIGGNPLRGEEWLSAFKRSDTHGRYDVVLLQVTHVEPDKVSHMTTLHARAWGFRTGPQCPTRSFWSPSAGCKGELAILVDPYGSLTDVRPVMAEEWSPIFMAVVGNYAGATFLFMCIYAPHQRARRDAFFAP